MRFGPSAMPKRRTSPATRKGNSDIGDVWTWTAIDADTKLVPSFLIGNRDARSARMFIEDLASRLASRVQLTTDGLKVYLEAVEGAFGCDIDYAMLVKTYESSQEETRYSPAVCTSCERKPVTGNPDPDHISTSLCRAPEPNHADEYAPIYPTDKRLLKESRKPRLSSGPSLHALQLLPDSQNT